MSATVELPSGLDTGRLLRRLAGLLVIALAVVAVIMLIPGLVDVRHRLAHARVGWLVAAAVLEVLSSLAYVVAFRAVFCARMSWGTSYRIGMSELGATALLPVGGAGGLALGAWALSRGGMATDRIARRTVAFFLVTSATNVGALILAGVALAAGILPGTDRIVLSLGPAALGVAGVVLVLALPRLTGRVPEGWSAEHRARSLRLLAGALRATGDGVGEALALLRSGDVRLLAGAMGYLVFDLMVFYACFRAFGVAPPVAHLLLAYLVGQLGGLIPLPGGLGGVDVGLVATLVLYGTPVAAATVGVLAYRALLLVIPSVLGGQAFVALRRSMAQAPPDVPCAEGP